MPAAAKKIARPSFLKKRSKRLLSLLSRRFLQHARKGTKLFALSYTRFLGAGGPSFRVTFSAAATDSTNASAQCPVASGP